MSDYSPTEPDFVPTKPDESITEATLEFVPGKPGYFFKSLGFDSDNPNGYGLSTSFPKGTMYKLINGKFPFTTHEGEQNKKKYILQQVDDKTLEKIGIPINVEVTGFTDSCYAGDLNKKGSCQIIVKIANKTAGGKNKSNRRKSNRRKSNRRKSNRRKSNRRR